jgi:hypothetical protein
MFGQGADSAKAVRLIAHIGAPSTIATTSSLTKYVVHCMVMVDCITVMLRRACHSHCTTLRPLDLGDCVHTCDDACQLRCLPEVSNIATPWIPICC